MNVIQIVLEYFLVKYVCIFLILSDNIIFSTLHKKKSKRSLEIIFFVTTPLSFSTNFFNNIFSINDFFVQITFSCLF